MSAQPAALVVEPLARPQRAAWIGISLLCAGVFVFALHDLLVKAVSGSYPVTEVLALRCAAALPCFLIFVALTSGVRSLASPVIGFLLLRGLILFGAYTLYYLGFPVLPWADATALYFTVPLLVMALAGPILGERIGLGRWLAVLIGFAGVIIALDPSGAVFKPAALFALGAAFLYAVAQVLVRRLGVAASAGVLSFYQNIVFLLAALVLSVLLWLSGLQVTADGGALAFLLRPWAMPTALDLGMMMACGPLALAGSVMLTEAYRVSEANLVAPFEYTGLFWIAFWGFALWGEVPQSSTLIGAAIIVVAGLFALLSRRK